VLYVVEVLPARDARNVAQPFRAARPEMQAWRPALLPGADGCGPDLDFVPASTVPPAARAHRRTR